MKINNWLMGLLVLVLIFGGIAGTMAFNLWNTEGGGGGKGRGGGRVPVTFNVGEFAGEYNPADIRGSYSFGDINNAFRIPVTVLGEAFGLEGVADLGNVKSSDLEAAYSSLEEDVEIGNSSLQLFVALYKGLPYTPSDTTTYLPQPAVDILKAEANLTEEQLTFLDTHSVDITGIQIDVSVTSSEESAEHEASTDKAIKGKTTFRELLDWGLSEGEIEAAIGEEMPARDVNIRDFAVEKGLEFGVIKEALQAKVDALR